MINGKSSNWRDVISGVPQGSVFDTILFVIHINDIDESLTRNISKFANDTKITSKITTTADKLQFQSNLDTLVIWSKKWLVKFNVNKCKDLHNRINNQYTKYIMKGSELSKVSHEKDLGVTISNDLKPDKRCPDVVKKDNKLVGFIGRTYQSRKPKKVMPMQLNALVCPRLEDCIQFWLPHYKKKMLS